LAGIARTGNIEPILLTPGLRLAEPLKRLTAALAARYRLERELGVGGQARVYLAENLKHKRKVAVDAMRTQG
jgi:serine/threonine-protein kinase